MKRRLLLRRARNSNGHWFDLAAGGPIDSRFKVSRSVSGLVFVLSMVVLLGAISSLAYWSSNLQHGSIDGRDLAESVRPSVFVIECGDVVGTAFAVDLPIARPYKSSLVTAAHVLAECEVGDSVTIRGESGIFNAEILGKAPTRSTGEPSRFEPDVAVLGSISAFPALPVSKDVSQGEWLAMMGHPWDYEFAFALGLASHVSVNEIVTDAGLNEGNSGGPAVNSKGQVVGFVSYYPYRADLYEGNVTGTYDRGDGLAVLKRINVLCNLPVELVGTCEELR